MVTSGWLRRTSVALLATFLATLSGCYHHIDIRPDQLQRLTAPPLEVADDRSEAGSRAGMHTVAVLTPDGDTEEIEGAYDLALTLSNGQRLELEYPISNRIDLYGALELHSNNIPPMRLRPGDVREATVVQLDGGLSVLAGVGIPILSLLMLGALLVLFTAS